MTMMLTGRRESSEEETALKGGGGEGREGKQEKEHLGEELENILQANIFSSTYT